MGHDRLTIPEFALTEAGIPVILDDSGDVRLTIPEFALTEARQDSSMALSLLIRLTIPEFALTEAFWPPSRPEQTRSASRFLNSR